MWLHLGAALDDIRQESGRSRQARPSQEEGKEGLPTSFRPRLKSCWLDAQKQLDDQMAADEKVARVEAKLFEIRGDPRYHGRFATRRREPPQDDQDELQKCEQVADCDIGRLEAKLLEINQSLASDDLSPEQRKEL
ncbi:unnamed protein product, partial [Mesorhabditis spiculigera]